MNEKEKEYCKLIGSIIRKLRKQQNKSLCMFAYENDIARSTLSRIEKGENECGLITLKKISDGLHWKMSEFFKNIEDNNGDIKLIDE